MVHEARSSHFLSGSRPQEEHTDSDQQVQHPHTSPKKDHIGADAAITPSTIWGYFIRIHAASMPPDVQGN